MSFIYLLDGGAHSELHMIYSCRYIYVIYICVCENGQGERATGGEWPFHHPSRQDAATLVILEGGLRPPSFIMGLGVLLCVRG